MITTEGLNKIYGKDKQALDDVDLHVPRAYTVYWGQMVPGNQR